MEENKNLETLGGLCSHILSSPMPVSDDVRECLTQLCVRPTCAAYIVFGMIQKAAKGDTSAAKFIKEINGGKGFSGWYRAYRSAFRQRCGFLLSDRFYPGKMLQSEL